MKNSTLIFMIFLLLFSNIAMVHKAYESAAADKERETATETLSYTAGEASTIANKYLSIDPYSKRGLIEELVEKEMMPRNMAWVAVESCDVDWEKNAKEEAEKLVKIPGYEKENVINALRAGGYTESEIKKAVE